MAHFNHSSASVSLSLFVAHNSNTKRCYALDFATVTASLWYKYRRKWIGFRHFYFIWNIMPCVCMAFKKPVSCVHVRNKTNRDTKLMSLLWNLFLIELIKTTKVIQKRLQRNQIKEIKNFEFMWCKYNKKTISYWVHFQSNLLCVLDCVSDISSNSWKYTRRRQCLLFVSQMYQMLCTN